MLGELNSWLSDTPRDIPLEVSRLTGISAQLTAGRSIPWNDLAERLTAATVVIAHHAEFERSFLRDFARDARWACSMTHIDWEAKGFRTRALNYLAADHGFVNPFPHRALTDCLTTFRLVTPYLAELLENRTMPMILVQAFGSAYETKDQLRERRYRWNPGDRVWEKTILGRPEKIADERAWLAAITPNGTFTEVQDVGVAQ